jgi:hypothetical protein
MPRLSQQQESHRMTTAAIIGCGDVSIIHIEARWPKWKT